MSSATTLALPSVDRRPFSNCACRNYVREGEWHRVRSGCRNRWPSNQQGWSSSLDNCRSHKKLRAPSPIQSAAVQSWLLATQAISPKIQGAAIPYSWTFVTSQVTGGIYEGKAERAARPTGPGTAKDALRLRSGQAHLFESKASPP
jgi:hypothetical protein